MLAVAGGKGGVGKSTTAVGLAHACSRGGERPLLVDADGDAPTLARALDVAAEPGLTAVADGGGLEAAVRPVNGVDLLPATPMADPGAVGDALTRLRGLDRPVVVDCPAGAGRPAAVPLRAACRAVVTSTPTTRALTDAAKTAAMARALETPVEGLVLTKTRRELDPGPVVDCSRLASVPAGDSPATPGLNFDRYRAVKLSVYGQNV
jgi:septum site-determining protein MinD